MKTFSIGSRLTFWYLAIFAAGQIIFGCGMWFILRHNVYRIMDENLAGEVQDVIRFLEAQKPKNNAIDRLREEFEETYALERQGDYLQVLDAHGEVVYRSPFLREHPLVVPSIQFGQVRYEDRELGGQTFRIISQAIDVRGRPFVVQTGIPTREMLTILWLFRRYLLMLAPLMLVIAAVVGHWLSSRALAPVDLITRTARNISASNLSNRLEKLKTGDELQRLSDTLNDMLARIESAFVRITEFTADASHELRTPVSLIRTEAEIALRRQRGEEEYQESLRHILLEAENTSVLVEKLLSLARADSSRDALRVSEFDLHAAIKEIAVEWRTLATIRNLELHVNIIGDELLISADIGAVRQLLTILLDNAIRYTQHGGIELCVEEKQGKALIKVCDSGIGISPEEQSKIFERFYRATNARNHGIDGAGLGLAIAQGIVQQHHGSIKVQSHVEMGSVFLVELPLSAMEVTAYKSDHQMRAHH